MNEADCCQHRTLTPVSLYTCIRAVLKLVKKLDADAVFGVAVVITKMTTAQDPDVVDFLLNKLPVLLPLSLT